MSTVYEIAHVARLTPENSQILLKGDFPSLLFREKEKEKQIDCIQVKRAFPFEKGEEFIVLSDENDNDLGFIRDLKERTAEEQEILRKELAHRYFMAKIQKIHKVADRSGYSYWNVETDIGKVEFSVRDTYKSIMYIGSQMIITDADGNRFQIEDPGKLDRSSRKKIDLYIR